MGFFFSFPRNWLHPKATNYLMRLCLGIGNVVYFLSGSLAAGSITYQCTHVLQCTGALSKHISTQRWCTVYKKAFKARKPNINEISAKKKSSLFLPVHLLQNGRALIVSENDPAPSGLQTGSDWTLQDCKVMTHSKINKNKHTPANCKRFKVEAVWSNCNFAAHCLDTWGVFNFRGCILQRPGK